MLPYNHSSRLNAYRIMWIMVSFDLPSTTKKEQKIAHKFRKQLLNDGFHMWQFSIYMRNVMSKEKAQVHIKRVETNLPPDGKVSILSITDKQYEKIKNFWGKNPVKPAEHSCVQLELF